MTRLAEPITAPDMLPEPAAGGPAPMMRISFLAGLLEQDGKRSWHVLATNDGRWFHSVERFPESARSAALDYLSQLQPGQRDPSHEADAGDRVIFHHPV